ncbi:fimbrial protein [Serratia sp. UGAL515B_01]|uniref:fimbrial protein n=1 Tax=Serratia sp. UGAL515B_01 TaxID=2986763 RepID=UPI002955AEB0|nr:fimbrial protein [Serratia sp. UGAL515B_01]WON77497.1 type 1 fimbrial protein [Serratia sp. UGAL515B_01]
MFAQHLIKWPQAGLVAGFLLGANFAFVTPVLAETCQAEGNCNIPVKFTGVYKENTCEISIDGKGDDAVVQLPKIATANLQSEGSEAGSTQFNIALKACPANTNINLYFVSTGIAPDTATGNLKNVTTGVGMSAGVQVRLRNTLNNQMRIDDPSTFQQYVIPANGGEVTQHYSASYYAGTANVTSGLVNTVAGIELRYN